MADENLQVQVSKVFATLLAFGLKAQNFHWNVEGQNFVEYHNLFDKLSNKAYKQLDCVAEGLRKMGVYVAANFEDLKALSAIQDTRNVPSNQEMLAILLNDCRILSALVSSTCKSLEVVGVL
ncbi:MAG: ferritin-like domain-containing protein, partial [Bacteroidota bacterium]